MKLTTNKILMLYGLYVASHRGIVYGCSIDHSLQFWVITAHGLLQLFAIACDFTGLKYAHKEESFLKLT